jgi:hypothetical protein
MRLYVYHAQSWDSCERDWGLGGWMYGWPLEPVPRFAREGSHRCFHPSRAAPLQEREKGGVDVGGGEAEVGGVAWCSFAIVGEGVFIVFF